LDDVPIIGAAWNIYNCIKDMYKYCWTSNPKSPPFEAANRFETLTGVRLMGTGGADLRAAARYLNLQADRVKRVLDLYAGIFGDPIWLSGSPSDGEILAGWFGEFLSATASDSPDGDRISTEEREHLMALSRPSQLSAANVTKFLDRWNRTKDYWAAGIVNPSDVPAGQSTDFIGVEEFKALMQAAKNSVDEMQNEGFTEIFGGLAYATDRFIDGTHNQEAGVCARVKIQIEQEAVMTRNAFKASLDLSNAGGSPLEDVKVVVDIRNSADVQSNSVFVIRDPVVSGISDVSGTGVLAPGGQCRAEWLLIPTDDAAPTQTATYYVGANLSYKLNGAEVTVPLFPDAITVKPNPSLYLDYFMQKYVYSDDPFTPEVEPAEPFALGIIVRNAGYGTAFDFRITSAQPQIIENEKGLLIDFKIIGTQVDFQEVSPSLTVN
ncbi:MAG: hypothetical protein ACPL7K_08440, partial [Armatimonadota bacterium]